MKKIIIFMLLSQTAALFVGYYRITGETEMYTRLFFKKTPTFQVKFDNIFANQSDPKHLTDLTFGERQLVRRYCKYRHGIETTLDTQKDLEQCNRR
ncbi:hypothetical protein [Pseudomonas sp. Ps21-P2]|uniref:hypothetical protein n=1 Tax=Pseudomonas sp. Ps21-P2 TaxID=3080331 RepID=UPI003207CD68